MGAATSSHQIEGYNTGNDWWAWEQTGAIDRKEVSGPATDHRNRFREDLGLAKELGLNSYRLSIEWSRIEPEEGRWDSQALEWYAEVLAECERLSLLPMVTLHHFTSPLWFAEQGDFTSELSYHKFANYVRKIVKTLGNRIPLWCTFNEPVIMCVGKYLAGFQPLLFTILPIVPRCFEEFSNLTYGLTISFTLKCLIEEDPGGIIPSWSDMPII